MHSQTQCRFCAKLPVINHLRSGVPTRCPLCKGHLVEDRNAGTTYRLVETLPSSSQGRSLGQMLAALFGIAVTAERAACAETAATSQDRRA